MLNIGIQFSERNFEYDVYSLVRAFYPAANVQMYVPGEEEPAGEFECLIALGYRIDGIDCRISVSGEEKVLR